MRSLRHTIAIKNGVKVEMLFTPHLYSFKGFQGVTFEADRDNEMQMFEMYCDVLFCSALNAWVLDGHGSEEDAPFTRGDFQEWMLTNPKEYGKALNRAIEALTGKTIADTLKERAEATETGKETEMPAGSKKKIRFGLIGRLLKSF